jgi:hypothetical protein
MVGELNYGDFRPIAVTERLLSQYTSVCKAHVAT